MNLSILYRGPLSSCNYGCEYCPFAKHAETQQEHEADRVALERFVNWIEERNDHRFSILFTPWGEALIRQRYQAVLVRLTKMLHIDKAAIQTNLSGRLDWVDRCDKNKLALWATFHPGETTRARFVARCLDLDHQGVHFSVGVVGLKEHTDEIEALRRELPSHIYVWINAYKRQPNYYSADELRRFEVVDPLFPVNNQYHLSRGRACHAGESVISVDGDGVMRRCHFIKAPIGNLYAPDFEQQLQPTPCSNATCGCHIGYVHMPELGLHDVFGKGVLERIPAQRLR